MKTETLTNQDIILSTVEYSISLTKEERINNFLDGINQNRTFLTQIALDIETLIVKLEQFTWFTNISETDLILMRACLISTEKLIKELKKSYAHFNSILRPKGVCKNELKTYLEIIRDLEETKNDVYLVYFELPKDTENNKLDKDIAKLL